MFNLRVARDSAFLRQASLLFGGNAGAAVLGLLSLSLTARALGVEAFGGLILVVTLVSFADKLINSQSWAGVIRYGTHAIARDAHHDVQALLRVSAMLDIGAAVLSACVAAGAGWVIHHLGGWGADIALLVSLYALTTLSHANGVATGVLRMQSRYAHLSGQAVLGAGLRLLLVLLAWALDAPMEGFLLAWAVSDIGANLLLIRWGQQEIVRANWGGFMRAPLKDFRSRFPRFWHFSVTNNIGTALRQATKEADVLVVGMFLGNAETGIYKVIKQLGSLAQRLIDPLAQIVYPELTKAYAGNDYTRLRILCIASAAIGSALGIGLWVGFYQGGNWLIDATVGPEFLGARLPGLWYFAGVALSAIILPLQPLTLAMGRSGAALWASVIATAAYFSSLALSLPVLGLFGAGMAHILFHAVSAACLFYVLRNMSAYFGRA